MGNQDHVDLLTQGVQVWNQWREANPAIQPDLQEVSMRNMELQRVNLSEANLYKADLVGTILSRSNLTGTNLRNANLIGVFFSGANLQEAQLNNADISWSNFMAADLRKADLSRALLIGADLRGANLIGADLSWAKLQDADLRWAKCREVNLRGADLTFARFVETDLDSANLTDSSVYGISAWNLKLANANQSNLVITTENEPRIMVDNLEVAQFIYLLLNNEKIRDVINTITSKAVLILGRFTPERKAVLDVLREELRRHDYLPILFDFDLPDDRDITETITLLARLARFIIADLTEPSSIPKELEAVVPTLAIPVQPLIDVTAHPYSMFQDYWKYDWVLDVYRYDGLKGLLASLRENVIIPAETKVRELARRRNS